MNTDRFDALLRSLSEMPSRRKALRLLAGAALGGRLTLGTMPIDAKKGGNGKGKGKGKKGKGKKGKKQKVTICHNGQTIRVGLAGLKGHQGHGDTIGPCPTRNLPNPPPSGPTCSPACRAGMRCAGEQCVVGQGTCPTGTNSCTSNDGAIACGLQDSDDQCQCHISTEGQTRCADSFGIDERSICGQCASSAECVTLYPAIPGVFCNRVSGAVGECCSPGTRGLCMAPCPTPPPCAIPEDCPDTLQDCEVRTCNDGLCGKAIAPEGTPLRPERQAPGDCLVLVCDGTDASSSRNDPEDSDLPDDGNECTSGSCNNGTPVHTAQPGAPCNDGAGQCDANGNCAPLP